MPFPPLLEQKPPASDARPACPATAFLSVQQMEQHQHHSTTTANSTGKLHCAPLVFHESNVGKPSFITEIMSPS